MTASLFLFDHLAGLLGRAGVDYPRFRAILAAQLVVDGRRQHGWVQGTRRVTPLVWSLLVHGVMGLWLAALPLLVPSALTALTIGLTVVMAMVAFDLVADYSAVLLDSTQAAVLAARPVSPRTVLAARLAHVGTYLTMYVGALAAGTCVTGSVRWGRAFLPAYLVGLLGTVVFVLAAVAIVYLALMRVVGRERLRDATMWAQLAMTGLTVAAYSIGSVVDVRTGIALEAQPWLPFYPPAWMAGLPALAVGPRGGLTLGLAAAGVLAPAVLLPIAIRLGASFRAATAGDAPRAGAVPARASRLASRLARWTTVSPGARAVFGLVWTLAARDRQFKTRTYPGLLAIVLFVAAFAVVAHTGVWSERFGQIGRTKMHLFLLYYGILVIPTPILMAPYTDRPDAAWVYDALPLDRPGTALLAGLQVLFLRFVLPVFACIAAVVLTVWGARAIWDVAFALAATMLVTVVFALVTGRRLPFSAPPPGGASGTAAGAILGGMLLVGALGAVHWLLLRVTWPLERPWPVVTAAAVVLVLAALATRGYARTGRQRQGPDRRLTRGDEPGERRSRRG